MCKRTMHKRARIPMFLWERRACANSGAQAVFPRPRKNGLGTRLISAIRQARARRGTLRARSRHRAAHLSIVERRAYYIIVERRAYYQRVGRLSM